MTICEAAKAMMFDQDLPNSLWAEATRTAVYVQNRCPHAILEDKTPEEAFTGMKPEIGHLISIWLPYLCPYSKRKANQNGPLREEGCLCGIQ